MAQEFLSFEEVLRELQVESEDLKKMIEEGEIKAFQDGGVIKFRKDEVLKVKNNKMDLPTLAIAPDAEEDFMMIEEVGEEGDDEPGEGKEAEDPSKPVLSEMESDTSSELEYELVKTDDELVFEQENGEDLLETGEMLFESKEQELPRDRELEELFPEDGLSPFDSREEKAIEEAWDLSEDDEDIIATSVPPAGKKLAIDESGARSKFRIFVSMVAGGMAFAVIVIFTLLPDRTRPAYVELSPSQIVEPKSIALFQQKSMAQIVQAEIGHAEIYAPADGTVKFEVLDRSLVEHDDAIAKIAFVPEIPGGEKAARAEIERCRASHKALKAPRESLQSLLEKVDQAQQDFLSAPAARKREAQAKYTKGVDFFAKQVDSYFAEASKHAAQHSAERPVSEDLKRLGGEMNRLQKEKKMGEYYAAKKEFFAQKVAFYDQFLSDLDQKDARLSSLLVQTPRDVPVVAPNAGTLNWMVPERNKVKSGQKIAVLEVVKDLKVVYNSIPDNEAVRNLNWVRGSRVKLQSSGREIAGTILERIDHFEYTPRSFDLEIRIEDAGDVVPGTTATLTYPQEESRWGVPVAAVMQDVAGSYVAVAKDGKIQRRNVQIGPREAEYIVVTGVERSEKVVVPQSDSRPIEDGQTIKMKE